MARDQDLTVSSVAEALRQRRVTVVPLFPPSPIRPSLSQVSRYSATAIMRASQHSAAQRAGSSVRRRLRLTRPPDKRDALWPAIEPLEIR